MKRILAALVLVCACTAQSDRGPPPAAPAGGTPHVMVVLEENKGSRQVIGNPHNQTLNVAVQWGTIGVVILYAMWLAHFSLFRGEGLAAWIGLMVVLQNVFSSLFNSHLFDFHEGWMYVLGVGIAGGMVLRARSGPAESSGTARP